MQQVKIDYEDLDDPGKITSVITVIEERKKAEQKYEDAVASGDKMAVIAKTVTRKSRNLIRVQMGNFPQNSRAVLTCSMFHKLPLIGDHFQFRLPLNYIPPYLRGEEVPAGLPSSAPTANSGDGNYEVNFVVHQGAENPVSQIVSTNHKMTLA